MPIDREKVLQAAQKYVEKKRYDGAIAEYQKIIQEDPNDARTLLKIGDLQARLQAYPEAIATYDRVGQYYATQGFSLKAIAVYKQIREIIKKHAPDLGDRYAHIGPRLAEIYTQLGLTSDALSAWDEVATRMQRAGRDREAVDIFRKMVELDANNPLPHLRLAEACCRVHALDDAIESFWTAADLLLNLGRQEDALKVIERILHFRSDPRFARVAAELYLGRATREDGLQALAKLQICFQADPKDLDTLGLLGQAFTLIGQADKAIEVYKEMARVARDQGRGDVYDGLVDHLRSVAPDDDQVRAFESFLPPNAPIESVPAQAVDDDVELIEAESVRTEVEEIHSSPDLLVVDDTFEAVEEIPASSAFDASAHARKAIVDAESFRKLRLFPKAIETLHIALEIDPRSLEIRGKLREILLESGDGSGALAESVNLAALHIDTGDLASAEPLLRQVLEEQPEHEGAHALWEQLGKGPLVRRSSPSNAYQSYEQYDNDPSAPLPSYDLEEISADQAMLHQGRHEEFTEDPLPSFPLAGETTDTAMVEDLDDVTDIEELPPVDTDALEQALEEAEFFVVRGLYEDARAILEEQLVRTPNHPLVYERLHEIDEHLGRRSGSQTIERSSLGAVAPKSLDVSASLDALDALELAPNAHPEPAPAPSAKVDADKIFAKFKAGIRAQVSENDSATHYDLGVAYKEMGLIADAVHELEVAARDSERECMCHAMIGLIHLEQGALDQAAESYIKALAAPTKTVEQEMNLYYDLGNVYEMKSKAQDALYYFQKIARRDPGYRDVADRIAALLQEKPISEPSGTRAVNDDDEFERVFDDLFESKSK
ncbi:MAG TPA: tetratricopeptide repeat protein [Polyangiaceae bacterium]|nr:tetratricopeptide repeat protein [Polyangiaceae bacterium]